MAVRLANYVDTVQASANVVFQYHRKDDVLRVWQWPSYNETPVEPSALQLYRSTHQCLGPCCLCPLMDAYKPDFVEAAIHRATGGHYSGEYVATCAQERCGYLVFLQRLYKKFGLPTKSYPLRGPNDKVPPSVLRNPLKRSYTVLDITQTLERRAPAQPAHTRAIQASILISELLARLDSRVQPGITVEDLRRIIVVCACGLVTTRRSFNYHQCLRPDVIDLTGDDRSSEAPTEIL